jgi:hypothetical protein
MSVVLWTGLLLGQSPGDSPVPKKSRPEHTAEYELHPDKAAGPPTLEQLQAEHTTWTVWYRPGWNAKILSQKIKGAIVSYKGNKVVLEHVQQQSKVCGSDGCRWEWRDIGKHDYQATDLGESDQRFLERWRQLQNSADDDAPTEAGKGAAAPLQQSFTVTCTATEVIRLRIQNANNWQNEATREARRRHPDDRIVHVCITVGSQRSELSPLHSFAVTYTVTDVVRASSRREAKQEALRRHPNAQFDRIEPTADSP